MSYYCELCKKILKQKSKYKHLRSTTHKELEKCQHIKLAFKNPNIN